MNHLRREIAKGYIDRLHEQRHRIMTTEAGERIKLWEVMLRKVRAGTRLIYFYISSVFLPIVCIKIQEECDLIGNIFEDFDEGGEQRKLRIRQLREKTGATVNGIYDARRTLPVHSGNTRSACQR
jgi:hypothetical protein